MAERTETMARTIATPLLVLSVWGALAAGTVVVGCGGASGGTRGVGGATGTGGVTGGGLGGATAGVGGAVSGVGGATMALDCPGGLDPAAPLLVDFSPATWMNTQGKWNTVAHDLTGSRYSAPSGRANPDGGSMLSTMTGTVDITATNPSLETKGTILPGDYGFSLLSFDRCVNTAKYTGIQFTLGGTTVGCDFIFELQTFDQQGVTNRGGCPTGGSCYKFPQIKVSIPATPGTPTVVHFSDLAGTGVPDTAAAMKAQIVGLQWQLQSAAPPPDAGQAVCSGIDVTIDDVGFVAD
jgi:hypothetical protein